MSEKLVHDRYRGEGAHRYDAARSDSARFAAETAAFSTLISQVNVRTVLDCPFGTGRWIPAYHNVDRVVGVDVSADMLQEAEHKIPSQERPHYELVCADIFEHDFALYRTQRIDLVVCVRFLNWVSLQRAKQALSRLNEVGSPSLIIGFSAVPTGAGSLYSIKRWTERQIARLRRRAFSYVHPPRAFTDHLAGLGWRETQRIPIFQRRDRENFFCLYQR